MKTLSHDTLVRLDTWVHSYATVGTLAGCAAERGNFEPLTARYIADQHLRGGSECWANTAPTFLSADKSHYDEARAAFASAVILTPDEIVEIEGSQFRVAVDKFDRGRRPRYSNSIKFRRVDDTALKAAIAELMAEIAEASRKGA